MGFYFKWLILPFILLGIVATYWDAQGRPSSTLMMGTPFLIWLFFGCIAVFVRFVGRIWKGATRDETPSQWPR